MRTTTDPLVYTERENVVTAMKLQSPAALEGVILTTSSANSDKNLNKTNTLSLQCISDMKI